MDAMFRVMYICLASGLLFATLGRGAAVTACCLSINKSVLPLKNIRDYHMQKVGLCPVDAVVFTTVKNVIICSDPKKPWVKKAVKYFDSKKKRTQE